MKRYQLHSIVGALALLFASLTSIDLCADPGEFQSAGLELASLEPFRPEDYRVAYAAPRRAQTAPRAPQQQPVTTSLVKTSVVTNLTLARPDEDPLSPKRGKVEFPRLTLELPPQEEKLGGFIGVMMPRLDPNQVVSVRDFRPLQYEGGTYQSDLFFRRSGLDVVTWDRLVYHFRIGEQTLFGPAFTFMQPNAQGINVSVGFQLTHTFGPAGR